MLSLFSSFVACLLRALQVERSKTFFESTLLSADSLWAHAFASSGHQSLCIAFCLEFSLVLVQFESPPSQPLESYVTNLCFLLQTKKDRKGERNSCRLDIFSSLHFYTPSTHVCVTLFCALHVHIINKNGRCTSDFCDFRQKIARSNCFARFSWRESRRPNGTFQFFTLNHFQVFCGGGVRTIIFYLWKHLFFEKINRLQKFPQMIESAHCEVLLI